MAIKWIYILDNKTKLGLVSLRSLRRHAKSGQLRTTDVAQQAGLPRWRFAGKIAGQFSCSAVSAEEPMLD